MKLVIAIVQDQDASNVSDGLVTHGFGATRINTAGGFPKRGFSTSLTGAEDIRANDAIQPRLTSSGRSPIIGNVRGSRGISDVPRF